MGDPDERELLLFLFSSKLLRECLQGWGAEIRRKGQSSYPQDGNFLLATPIEKKGRREEGRLRAGGEANTGSVSKTERDVRGTSQDRE